MTDAIDLELNRLWALDAEWDAAADALARHDFRAFDEAMARFRELESSRDGECANNGSPVNNGK